MTVGATVEIKGTTGCPPMVISRFVSGDTVECRWSVKDGEGQRECKEIFSTAALSLVTP